MNNLLFCSPVEVSESRLRGGSQTSLVTTTNPSKVFIFYNLLLITLCTVGVICF